MLGFHLLGANSCLPARLFVKYIRNYLYLENNVDFFRLICLFCGLVYVGEYSEWCRVQLWFLVQCQCEFRLPRGGVMYQLFTSMVALVLLCGETLVLLFRAIIFSLQGEPSEQNLLK